MTTLTVPSFSSIPTFNRTSQLTPPIDQPAAEESTAALAPIDNTLQVSSVEENSSFELVRAETRLRSQTKLRIDDDGSIRFKTRTHLRYKYEFESADGTRIQIKAQANLSFSAKLDADGNATIKSRAKLQISLLQESVNSDAANLFSLGESDELIALLTEALAAFNDVVTQATSGFLNSETLNGDGLITDLVNAFNTLADATDSTRLDVLPQPDLPTEEAESEEHSTSPESRGIPNAPPPIDVLRETPAALKLAENPPFAETFAAAINQPAATEPAETSADVTVHEPVTQVEGPVAEEPEAEADETETHESAELAPSADFQSLRLQLRFKFTESLYQLLKVFDGSDEEPSTVTRLSYRFSADLKLSYRFDAADGSEPEIPALDASA